MSQITLIVVVNTVSFLVSVANTAISAYQKKWGLATIWSTVAFCSLVLCIIYLTK